MMPPEERAEQIIVWLDNYAREYDNREYGLPIHSDPIMQPMLERVAEAIRAVEQDATAKYSHGGTADIRVCSTCSTPYPDFGVSSHMTCWNCRRKAAVAKVEQDAYARGRAEMREECARTVERMNQQDPGNYPYSDGISLSGKSEAAVIRALK